MKIFIQTINCSLLLFAWLLFSACGSSDATITIKAHGMSFSKNEIHVSVGQRVDLQVVNRDDYPHSFDLDEFNIHMALAAHAALKISFTPQQAGRYRFYCGAPGHAGAGMEGILIVKP